ncbi:MAG: LPS-assembly protein LptD [Candidatus Binataceae bacterium]
MRKLCLLAALCAAILIVSAAAWAAGPPGGGVPLEVQGEHAGPISITGKETIFDSNTDIFYVRGDAVMTQGGSVLTADEIDVMRRQRQARAIGHVHLVDNEVEIWASEGKIDIATETLELDNATVLAKKGSYHLQGKKIIKLAGQNYKITQGFFTTCGCSKGTPDWAISADTMDVQVGGVGTAENAGFSVLGHRIMKLPFAEFPADTSRHSGLLSGRYGESGLRGFQWLQPYYLAIDKSSDATVALDVETSQRVGGLAEYRLVSGVDDYLWTDGAFYDESIRSDANRQSDIVDPYIADPSIPLDRYGLIAMGRQHLGDGLIAYGDAISVSDSLYLREMDVWTLSRGFGNYTSEFQTLRNAASNFGFLDEFNGGFARLAGQWNQDLIQPQEFALQRLPEFTLSGFKPLANGLLYADYDAAGTFFYRYQGVDGGRFNVNPRVTLPFHLGDYLYGSGTAGMYGSVYDTYGHNLTITPVGQDTVTRTKTNKKGVAHNVTIVLNPNNNVIAVGPISQSGEYARAIPYLNGSISTVLDRVYDVNGATVEKLKNTVEPFVNYAYVPRIYQGNSPLFDQWDRIESRSLITYGFTTRLFAKINQPPPGAQESGGENGPVGGGPLDEPAYGPDTGQAEANNPASVFAPAGPEIMRNGSYSRLLADLTVQQAYDTAHEVTPSGGNVSDVEAILDLYPTTVVSLHSQVDYNPRNHAGLTLANVGMELEPPPALQQVSTLYMGKALQGSFLQMNYSYVSRDDALFPTTTSNASEFISARAYGDLFDYLGVYVAPDYDIADAKLLSAEYGVRLKSPCNCWAADMGLVDSFNPNEVQVQFQLTLGGLGSIGESPFGRNPFQTMGLVGSPTGVLPRY